MNQILVCSPSGALTDASALDRGIAALQQAGFEVSETPQTRLRVQRFAGNDEERLAALDTAFHHPGPATIMASRGGYGLSRLLGQMPLQRWCEAMVAQGLTLCGHSDVTALQLALLNASRNLQANHAKADPLLARLGLAQTSGDSAASTSLRLLHGPMVCFDFGDEAGVSPTTYRHFEEAVFEGRVEVPWTSGFHQGRAGSVRLEGPAWGGNLVMLTSLLGTPYWPNVEGGILILEDVNEPVYKIERMLMQLLHAGVLQQQKAIILGQFSEPKPHEHDGGYALNDAIACVHQKLSLGNEPAPAILSNFPFGHVRPKACFYQGVNAVLSIEHDVDDNLNHSLRCVLTQTL